ncbi:MAG: hypothetical protein VX915_03485 [Pseudomonadota bacterium]|nr:hypothetical protein [Pseudomonadota bacterium]
MLVKTLSAFVLGAVSRETWAHALGADPTVIERVDAGLMLPSELSLAWVFWLVFGLWIAQNLEGAPLFFIGAASGIIVASLLGPISLDVSRVALILGLLVSAWICFGRESDPRLSALVIFILSALSMSMVFLVHADLSEDRLIRSIAAIFMLLSASFFGGLFKQIDRWFPKQTPIGIRILSSWVVAVIAIQIAMSMISK